MVYLTNTRNAQENIIACLLGDIIKFSYNFFKISTQVYKAEAYPKEYSYISEKKPPTIMNKTRDSASANEKLKCICAETQLKVAKLEL